jgi:spore coat protein SA
MKKGAHVLLNAMKKVMSEREHVALVIVGSRGFGDNEPDEYTRSLQAIARDLRGPVVFTGFLKPIEISAYYDLANVFVCPSQWEEPLARVHYEAMAAGVPIITTNRGGNAEVVSGFGNGIVLEKYTDDRVLAEQIQYLLENPSKALAMGKIGRKLAEDKFTWERVAEDLLSVFQTVENKNTRG